MPKPLIILVAPQMSENIGMCARAMHNCGLEDLRLVTPRHSWPDPNAHATATKAQHIIQNAQSYPSIAAATADSHHIIAASARSRDLNIPTITATQAAEEIHQNSQQNPQHSRTAVLFGPEASGLDNHALAHADRLMQYPMNPDYSSLNLAQAVLLFAWEWRKQQASTPQQYPENTNWQPAPKQELNHYLQRLETLLSQTNFLDNPQQKNTLLQRLSVLHQRANPSSQELNTLHGILTALTSPQRNAE